MHIPFSILTLSALHAALIASAPTTPAEPLQLLPRKALCGKIECTADNDPCVGLGCGPCDLISGWDGDPKYCAETPVPGDMVTGTGYTFTCLNGETLTDGTCNSNDSGATSACSGSCSVGFAGQCASGCSCKADSSFWVFVGSKDGSCVQ